MLAKAYPKTTMRFILTKGVGQPAYYMEAHEKAKPYSLGLA